VTSLEEIVGDIDDSAECHMCMRAVALTPLVCQDPVVCALRHPELELSGASRRP
jgi:hypothetical protein